jgi:hypothetical protein
MRVLDLPKSKGRLKFAQDFALEDEQFLKASSVFWIRTVFYGL